MNPHKRTSVRIPFLVSIVDLAIVFLTIYLKGREQFFWIYPGIVIAFFLTSPRTAAIMSGILLACLLPVILPQTDAMVVGTLYISASLTAVGTYSFSHRMRFQQEQLTKLSIEDPLTGAGNRRALEEKLQESNDE